MFFILLFNALLAMAELTAAFQSRPILMKHKSLWASQYSYPSPNVTDILSCFYRPAAYALAQVVVDVPLVFIQVVLFDVIVYLYALIPWPSGDTMLIYTSMSNLSRTASQFFINFLFIFLLTMTMYSFFRSLGALVSSLDVGTLNWDTHDMGTWLTYCYSYTPYWSCNSSPSCVYRYDQFWNSLPRYSW